MRKFQWKPPGPISAAFYWCNDPVSIMQGPVRGGKTLTAFARALRHMQEQAPSPDGIRRTRAVFARNSYPQLDSTTFRAFTELFPEGDPKEGGYGWIKHTPPKVYHFKFNDVECDIHFMAFDGPDDVDNLKSMEITFFFVNELQFFSRDVFDVLRERCTWPDPFKQGVAPTWTGGFADMNAPMSMHWVPIMRGDVPIPPYISANDRPAYEVPRDEEGRARWSFFVQPPGLIEKKNELGETIYEVNRGQGVWPDGPERGLPMPAAENLENLERIRPNYYLDEAQGKPKLYIETQILGRPAAQRGGKPIHPDYDDSRHYFDADLKPDPRETLWIGLDFGLHFAATFAQCVGGQWRFLSEIYLEHVTNKRCAQIVRAHLFERFPEHSRMDAEAASGGAGKIRIYGDPSGDFGNRSGMNDFQVFAAAGLTVLPAPGGNRFEAKEGRDEHGSYRKGAMDHALVTSAQDGKSGLLITRSCPLLREGLRSGYVWEEKTKKDTGERQSREKVEKSVYSHVVESAQYLLVGGGAGAAALGQAAVLQKVNTLRNTNVYDRGARTSVYRR